MRKNSIKKILIFFIFSLSLIFNNNIVYAAEYINNGGGDYKIDLKLSDKENGDKIGDSRIRILKVKELNDEGKEKELNKVIIVNPSGINIDGNGYFDVSSSSTIVIPDKYGKGVYKIEELYSPDGYDIYDGEVLLEFPLLENGYYRDNQTVKVDLKHNRSVGGFYLQIFEENESGKMTNIKRDLKVFYRRIEDENGKKIKNKFTEMNYDLTNPNYFSKKPLGKYEIKIDSLADKVLKLPNKSFFVTLYQDDNGETNIKTEGYSDYDATIDASNLNSKLFLFKDVILNNTEVDSVYSDKLVAGEEFNFESDVFIPTYATKYGEVELEFDYDNEKFSNTKIIANGQKVENKHGQLKLTLPANSGNELNIKINTTANGPYDKPEEGDFKIAITDAKDYMNTFSLLPSTPVVTGSISGDIVYKKPFKEAKKFSSSGKISVRKIDNMPAQNVNGETLNEVQVNDAAYNVDRLPYGEYKLSFTTSSDSEHQESSQLYNTTFKIGDKDLDVDIDRDVLLISNLYFKYYILILILILLLFIGLMISLSPFIKRI